MFREIVRLNASNRRRRGLDSCSNCADKGSFCAKAQLGSFIRFDRTPTCDRHRQTQDHNSQYTALAQSSRGKNRTRTLPTCMPTALINQDTFEHVVYNHAHKKAKSICVSIKYTLKYPVNIFINYITQRSFSQGLGYPHRVLTIRGRQS